MELEYVSSAWQVVTCALALLLGVAITLVMCRKFRTSQKWGLLLYFWHTGFSLFYAKIVLENGGDAVDYYVASLESDIQFSVGTAGVDYFTRFFSHYLDFSYLGVFLVYNIFGVIGLLAFDAVLRTVTRGRGPFLRWLAIVIVMLPSISFWSSAIGKDSVAFMATSLALWASMSLPRRSPQMILAIVCMFLVRPHIAGVMIGAIAASALISSRMPWKWRALLVGLALSASAVVIPFSMRYAGLGDATSAADVTEYIQKHQGYNQQGGGAIDVAGMSLPMQLFSYVFRPLPYEAHDIFGLAASADNVILLMLFVLGVWGMIRKGSRVVLSNRPFLWLYIIGAWLILAPMTANLGIAVRQKWMFVPMLICLLMASVRDKPVRRLAQEADPAPSAALPTASLPTSAAGGPRPLRPRP